MKIRHQLFAILVAVLAGCNSTKEEKHNTTSLLNIHVDEVLDTQPLRLSELMTVSLIVPLETRPDVVLPSALRIAVTDHYIIASSEIEINQFDLTGKFIRVLARQGNGPQEFTGFNGFAVDKASERLYYNDVKNRTHISTIDLTTGKFLPAIPLPLKELDNTEGLYLSHLEVDDDHNLWGVVPSHFPSSQVVFSITPDGQYLGGIPRSNSYKLNFNDRWHHSILERRSTYKEPGNDTLFTIMDWEKKPVITLNVADYHESVTRVQGHGEKSNETLWNIAYRGSGYFVVMRTAIYRWPEGGYGPNDRQYIFAPINSGPFLISSVFIDSLGYEMDGFDYNLALAPPVNRSGDIMIYRVNADEFKQKAREVLSSATVSPDVKERVKKLDRRIKESDNPILLIGKIK